MGGIQLSGSGRFDSRRMTMVMLRTAKRRPTHRGDVVEGEAQKSSYWVAILAYESGFHRTIGSLTSS